MTYLMDNSMVVDKRKVISAYSERLKEEGYVNFACITVFIMQLRSQIQDESYFYLSYHDLKFSYLN